MITSFPILLPFMAILFMLFSGKNIVLQKVFAVIFTLGLISISILIYHNVSGGDIMVSYVGNWKAPFGISLVIDRLSAIMLLISSSVSFCIAVYSIVSLSPQHHKHRFFLFFFGMLMGINGTFITGDIFNMYVWFEVMLIASFVLMVLGNKRRQLEGGLKYLTINLTGSLLFLAGVGILYGYTGTLNLAHLARNFRSDELPVVLNLAAAFLFVAFGVKAAIIPFFYWLPSSYHTPPVAISAFFAGLLTKVGIYSMIRVSTLLLSSFNEFWHILLLISAVATMLFGAVAAFSQNDIRRLLAFSIISQMGYLIMGLGFFTPLAIAATIFFIIHNVLVKTNLYLLSGIMAKSRGSFMLANMNGGYYKYPVLAFLFLLSAMALGGLPPLSGFYGKFLLARAGMESGHLLVAGLSLLTGLITLAYIFRAWNNMFWKEERKPSGKENAKPGYELYIAPGILMILILLLSLSAGNVFDAVQKAAEQLMDTSGYINEVLKSQGTP